MDLRKDCINVSLRIRPALNTDNTCPPSLQVISRQPPVLLVVDRSQTYHFDNIFSEEANQQRVYDDAVKPFVEHVKKGFNCTVFAYGQTGTGKTYTMGSGSQKPVATCDSGIIPRALEQIFEGDKLNSDQEINVFVSFSEIYNEKVFDLLQPDIKTPLPVSGFVVQGLSLKSIENVGEAKELLELGNKNRHVGGTKQNLNSSRSHAIFTVHFSIKNSCKEVKGKLNLVDLAGSESVRKTGSKGNTFQEGININKGLLSIGQVISALSMKSSHIPYRQSMITSILQGSLNVDNYISLIACVSAHPDDVTETLQTLDFAQRVKKVRNKPEVNQIIAKFKKDNPNLCASVRTPMKRASGTPLKTPHMKRMAPPPMPLINESQQSQTSHTEGSRSQFSIDFSSVSTSTDITQQTLSPVIRKYMTKMEVSIMDRLETVIKSSLRRPTRASLQAENSHGEKNKENTPSISWNKLQNEVSRLVKSEIAQLSARTVRATSSPLEEIEKERARRILNYDSPENLVNNITNQQRCTTQDALQNSFLFKVPELPVKKKNKERKSKLSISPIENQMPKITPRRSMRLSLKKRNKDNSILELSKVSFDSSMDRRHTESTKNNNLSINDNNNLSINDPETTIDDSPNEISQSLKEIKYQSPDNDSDFELSPAIIFKGSSKCNSSVISPRRRSIRISKKKEIVRYESPKNGCGKKKIGYNVAMTPAKIFLRKQNSSRDSPYTAHSKKVLKVLNRGSLKELEKLHSIGSKTAEQILLFRKLKGSLNQIEDLTKVPGWGTKKYEKFVALNFLRKTES